MDVEIIVEEVVVSIKIGKPDLVKILELATKILPALEIQERNIQRERLGLALSEQKTTEEILWSIAAFKFKDLLVEKIITIAETQTSIQTSINLGFTPPLLPETLSIISLIVSCRYWTLVEIILECPEQFSLDWNAAPTEGLDKGKSALWYLAANCQKEPIKIILENSKRFPNLDWNAAPTEGPSKSKTALWFLVRDNQREFIKIILENSKRFPNLDWNAAPEGELDKGVSVLWALAYRKQKDLIKIILKHPEQFTGLDWNVTPERDDYKGISVLWMLAEYEQWDLIKIILEHPKRFPLLDWNAAPMEGECKGVSVLWILARNKQQDLIKIILEHPKRFPLLDWNIAPSEGPDKGKSVLWVLVTMQQWNLLEIILKNPESFSNLDWNSASTERSTEGKSVLFGLVYYEQWYLIKSILEHSEKFSPLNWDAAPIVEGQSKGISTLWALTAAHQWDLIKVILQRPEGFASLDLHAQAPKTLPQLEGSIWEILLRYKQWESIQLILQNPKVFPSFAYTNKKIRTPSFFDTITTWFSSSVSIYSDILKCEDKQQRSIMIKTYLLSRRVLDPIPSDCKKEIDTYQTSLDNTFAVIANSLLNNWDKNYFNLLPLEIRQPLLQPIIYTYDPELKQIPWQLLKTNLDTYIDKGEKKLQEDAYHLTVLSIVGRFFSNKTSEAKEIAKEFHIETKANIASWLEKANPNHFFLTFDKREKLVTEIIKQPTLDQESVTQSFKKVFNM